MAVEDQDLCSRVLHGQELSGEVLRRGRGLLPSHDGQARLLGALLHQVGAAGAEGVGIVQEPDLGELGVFLDVLTMAPAAMESSGRTRNSQGFPCLVMVTLVAPMIVGMP